MKTSNKILITGFVVILAATIIGVLYVQSILLLPAIEGNGKLTEVTRTVSGFEKIKVKGKFTAYYMKTDIPELRISADQNLHEYIQTDIHNQTLTISFTDPVRSKNEIKVWIGNDILTHLEVHSAANFRVEDPLSQPQLYIKANGAAYAAIKGEFTKLDVQQNASSRVVLEGTTDSLTVMSNAAGTVDAFEMHAHTAILTANAAATINVSANEIDATANAAGVINYSGSPVFRQIKMSAGGKIISQ